MSFDEEDLRRALDARSAAPAPDLRSRLRQAVTRAPQATGSNTWLAAIAVIVVTLLTATSVGVLVAGRHARGVGTASGPRIVSPAPALTPAGPASNVQLSAPLKGFVWALVDYHALYVSTDSGDHWEQRSLPDNVGIKPSIAFISDSWGWLLAPGSPTSQCEQQTGTVWRTTDGARTWQRLPAAGIADSQCKAAIYFTDAGHGFVTAWDDNHRPTVYWTNDGGLGWKSSILPDNPLFVTGSGGFTLRVGWIRGFGSDIYLEASGAQHDSNYPRDFVYTSSDGGATWTWKQKLASPNTYMVSELRWLQLAPDVEESVNGGQAFAPYTTDLRVTPPFQAVFVNVNVGFVVGGAVVQRTVDGGAHWTTIASPWVPAPAASPTPSPSQIPMPTSAELSAPSANVLWALVAFQHLFFSTDEGATWEERSVPQGAGIGESIDIAFIDADNGWLSTCEGPTTSVWRTADGARSWQPVHALSVPGGNCLRGLYFADLNHGYMTYGSTVYRSQDGGLTWSTRGLPAPPGRTGSPFVLNLASFGTVTLASTMLNGSLYVYRSSDFGASWSYAAGVPSQGGAVAFVTPLTWMLLNGPGQSMETSDAGKTWHAWPTNYSQAAPVAPQVVFANSSVGYAAVRGSVQRTVDGGAHWELIKNSWP